MTSTTISMASTFVRAEVWLLRSKSIDIEDAVASIKRHLDAAYANPLKTFKILPTAPKCWAACGVVKQPTQPWRVQYTDVGTERHQYGTKSFIGNS